MKMPSPMRASARQARVPQASIERSSFDRSHGHKTTFDVNKLIPVYVDEALPGDTFNLRMSAFVRLATPLKPLMDNLYLDTFFFAVPYRLVWENWERFNGAQDDPSDSTSYLIPQTDPRTGWITGSLEDYMGLPLEVGNTSSCLPVRAYWLIWNEWFRDQNLMPGRTNVGENGVFVIDDGPDVPPLGGCVPATRGKRHDYFTGCLPWPQKGPSVSLPVAGAEVIGTGTPSFAFQSGNVVGSLTAETASSTPSAGFDLAGGSAGAGEHAAWGNPQLEVGITSTTINALREAFQVQKLLERDARGGTRYTEIIKSHFRVDSADARLQRPEYLGGGSAPIMVTPIAQNSASGLAVEPGAEPTEQGNLAGIGTGSLHGHGFVKSFTEHVILLGLVNVRADLTYQQGSERMWNRTTRYDFFWPAFAHLGEQGVLNKEIFSQGTAEDHDIFGYQERYAEYRYKPSRITGLFRSKPSVGHESLDIWHVSQYFDTLPSLNTAFIEEDTPVDRVLAVPSEPDFLFDSYFKLVCARPMPMYGVPGLIDHF